MNNKVYLLKTSLLALMLICLSSCSENGFWSGMGDITKTCLETFGGAAITQSCIANGYSAEETTKMVTGFYDAIGADQRNLKRGVDFLNAEKQERQSIIKGLTLEAASTLAKDPVTKKILDYYRQETDIQTAYHSEYSKATTYEARQAAINNRNLALANLQYDTYQMAKEAQAANLSKKLNIKKKLVEKGYDPSLAEEVAGNILAIQKSDRLSEEEKNELLKKYDFIGSTSEIQSSVEDVTSGKYVPEVEHIDVEIITDNDVMEHIEEVNNEKGKSPEEERSILLGDVERTKIDRYSINSYKLSDDLKNELDKVAATLLKYEDVKVQLLGHSCDIGNEQARYNIGILRAKEAKTYLVEKGIEANRISVESMSSKYPAVPNNSSDNRAKNRRVEIKIIK